MDAMWPQRSFSRARVQMLMLAAVLVLFRRGAAAVDPENPKENCSNHPAGGHQSHEYVALLAPFVGLASAVATHRVQRHWKRWLSWIPFTVLLLLEGIVIGMISDRANRDVPGAETNDFTMSIEMWRAIDPHLLLYGFLPALVFGDAMNLNMQKLKTMVLQVVLLATVGVGIGAALTAVVAKFLLPYGWDWNTAMVFGSICSATDPVAVVAVLKSLGVSPKLTMLIEGESLFNDGTAMVLFLLFNNLIEGETYSSAGIVAFFAQMVLGAVVLGASLGALGILNGLHLRDTATDHMAATIQVTTTISLAYLSFYAGEKCHMSGVLCCVSSAFMISKYGWPMIGQRQTVEHVWHTLEFCGNAIIFMLAGLIISGILDSHLFQRDKSAVSYIDSADFGYGIVVYVMSILIRFVMLLLLWPVLAHTGYGISWRDLLVAGWGGLRGAVGLALAIYFETNEKVDKQTSSRVLFVVSVFVTLTLLINAVTAPFIVRVLGLSTETSTEKMLDEAVLRRFHAHAMDTLVATIAHKKRGAGDLTWYDTVGYHREAVRICLQHVAGREGVFPASLSEPPPPTVAVAAARARRFNSIESSGEDGPDAAPSAVTACDDGEFLRYSRKTEGGAAQVWAFKTKDRAEFPYGPANPGDFIVVRQVPVPDSNGCYDIYGVSMDYFEANYVQMNAGSGPRSYRKMGGIFARKMPADFELPAVSSEGKASQVQLGSKGDYIVRAKGAEPYLVKASNFNELYELDEIQHWRTLREAAAEKERVGLARSTSARNICSSAEIASAMKRFSTHIENESSSTSQPHRVLTAPHLDEEVLVGVRHLFLDALTSSYWSQIDKGLLPRHSSAAYILLNSVEVAKDHADVCLVDWQELRSHMWGGVWHAHLKFKAFNCLLSLLPSKLGDGITTVHANYVGYAHNSPHFRDAVLAACFVRAHEKAQLVVATYVGNDATIDTPEEAIVVAESNGEVLLAKEFLSKRNDEAVGGLLLQMINTRNIVNVVLAEMLRYSDALLKNGVADIKLHERMIHLVQADSRMLRRVVHESKNGVLPTIEELKRKHNSTAQPVQQAEQPVEGISMVAMV